MVLGWIPNEHLGVSLLFCLASFHPPVIRKWELPISSLLVFLFVTLIGTFCGITIFRKLPHIPTFIALAGLFVFSLSIIILLKDPAWVYSGLGGLGFAEGAVYGRAYFMGYTSLSSLAVQERAVETLGQKRAFYIVIFNAVILIPCLLLGFFNYPAWSVIFPLAAYGIIFFLLMSIRSQVIHPKQRSLPFHQFIAARKFRMNKIFYFFCGLIRLPFFFGVVLFPFLIGSLPIPAFFGIILLSLLAELSLSVPLGASLTELGGNMES